MVPCQRLDLGQHLDKHLLRPQMQPTMSVAPGANPFEARTHPCLRQIRTRFPSRPTGDSQLRLFSVNGSRTPQHSHSPAPGSPVYGGSARSPRHPAGTGGSRRCKAARPGDSGESRRCRACRTWSARSPHAWSPGDQSKDGFFLSGFIMSRTHRCPKDKITINSSPALPVPR